MWSLVVPLALTLTLLTCSHVVRASDVSERVSDQAALPVCFSTPELRSQDLAGRWVQASSQPLYWNLSCSAEWSKYSCVHQGSTAHAKNAASYRFIPSDCRLLEFDAKSFVEKLSSRRVIFSGDSFVRQVLIAFACLLEHHKLIRHKNIPWASCREKWPCHNAKNCIQCGPHSGFFEFDFSLHSTSPHQPQFKYINEVNGGAHKGALGTLKKGDIFFLAPGIFGTPLKATSNAWGRVTSHMKKNVSVVWVHTWPAHFPTADGEYHVEELLLRNNSATNHTNSSIRQTSASTCVDKSDFERKSVEAHFLEQKKQLILGTLWLNGIEKLGMAKVGAGAGILGDCQHFCLPGPPDEIARVIYTYLMAVIGDVI